MKTLLFAAALLCGGLSLTACNKDAEAESAGGASVDSVSSELQAGNFGRASELAAQLVSANPSDPQAHLLYAKAEARLGNAGNAVRAVERAILAGLTDVSLVLKDPAFEALRSDPAFRRLSVRFAAAPGPSRLVENEERITAGDVSISSGSDGEVIRAGDLVLDAN